MRLTTTIAAVVLLVLASTAAAFPFSKKGGVTELNGKTLPKFLNTHKAVFVMFYAPWCGHCKTMHPDYEKFGKSVKDVVRVGAVNADQHKEVGGQYQVQGFPTIKFWPMNAKKGASPQDYQGQRTFAALKAAALREVKPKVSTATSVDAITKLLGKTAKVAILFTAKPKSPPMFSVLSQSPHYTGKLGFAMVLEKSKDVAAHFGVETFPSIVVVEKAAGEASGFAQVAFPGKVEYTPIAKFLLEQVGEGSADGDAKKADAAEGDVKPAAATEGEEEKAEEPKEKEVKKPARPAAPVRPTELTAEAFATHCAHGAPKVRGQQPFCVVAPRDDLVDLAAVHGQFQNDAVLFFWLPSEGAAGEQWLRQLGDGLQPAEPLTADDLVVLRAAKDKVKYQTFRAQGDAQEAAFGDFLTRILGGDVALRKNAGFPELVAVQAAQ